MHVSLHSFACMYFQLLLMCSRASTPTLCPVLILSVSCQMEMVICVAVFFPSSALIPFKHADKFNPSFRAVCWHVWCGQKIAFLLCRSERFCCDKSDSLTEQLRGLLAICLSFDLWMTEWLASFQTSDMLTRWLAGCKSEQLPVTFWRCACIDWSDRCADFRCCVCCVGACKTVVTISCSPVCCCLLFGAGRSVDCQGSPRLQSGNDTDVSKKKQEEKTVK